MIVAKFEQMLLDKGVSPIHLIMGKGRQVKWFVCMQELDGKHGEEYTLQVYDENGRCFINPKRYEEIDFDTHYNICVRDEGRLLVNGMFFYAHPSSDLNFA